MVTGYVKDVKRGTKTMAKCIECKVKDGDAMQYGDNDRYVTVKLVNGPFGPLCQRHTRNAYARAGTAKKRNTKREQERQEMRERYGNKDMFDLEGSE